MRQQVKSSIKGSINSFLFPVGQWEGPCFQRPRRITGKERKKIPDKKIPEISAKELDFRLKNEMRTVGRKPDGVREETIPLTPAPSSITIF